MRPGWWTLWLVLPLGLTGCQTTPTTLPEASPRPAAECHWPTAIAGGELLRRGVETLEAEGFLIRLTDTALGLVRAERSRVLPGYGGFDDPWLRPGVFGGIGVGGGRVGGGVIVGLGAGTHHINRDATEVERVVVLVGEQEVRVTRDIRLFDWRGRLRESRGGSDADFCTRLRQGIEAG